MLGFSYSYIFIVNFSFWLLYKWQKSKDTKDYIFAGSKLPFWVSSFAFFGNFGSEMIMIVQLLSS